jgi:hypothetical protein
MHSKKFALLVSQPNVFLSLLLALPLKSYQSSEPAMLQLAEYVSASPSPHEKLP